MTSEEIQKILNNKNSEVSEAHKEIISLQNNKENILKFGQEWLDENVIGGINNKIIFLGSRPSNGKTHHCSETINALLDPKINPTPVEVCRLNLEMPTQALLLQQISRTLDKPPKEILSGPFSEQEKPLVQDIVNSFMDERIQNVSKVMRGQDFQSFVEAFCAKIDESDKEHNEAEVQKAKKIIEETGDRELAKKEYNPKNTKKVVLIDHLMIYRSKDEIDDILLRCNAMKMADKNLSFIIYFQLRRDVEDLWRGSKDSKVNPRNMLPDSRYIYMSDVLQQVADIVVGMVIPQVYDLDEYAAIHKNRNNHLEKHFVEEDVTTDSDWIRLKGRNRIYYNFIKIRLINSFEDPRLFCNLLNPNREEEIQKVYKKEELTIQMPVFNATKFQVNDPKDAFDDINPEDENKSPF